MLKPRMPAPRAENIALSFTTALVSKMSIGRRCLPVKSLTILASALDCAALVSRSKKIWLRCCPVVPLLVMVR